MKLLNKYAFLGAVGGVIYYCLELWWRNGYSHWSMFILGGICFIILGLINELLEWETSLLVQMLIGCTVITILEFITGCVVNIWLGWNVWDYSVKPYNILGQVCLENSVYWYFLSFVGIWLDDWIRYYFFGEEKPRYYLI